MSPSDQLFNRIAEEDEFGVGYAQNHVRDAVEAGVILTDELALGATPLGVAFRYERPVFAAAIFLELSRVGDAPDLEPFKDSPCFDEACRRIRNAGGPSISITV